MTDQHSDKHPAEVEADEARAAEKSSKFRGMFLISTSLIVVAMIVIFLVSAL